jgi:hypothetical protein
MVIDDSYFGDDDSYLGDGLYASFDGWQIELYASNGIEKTNSVLLDSDTLAAFLKYVERLQQSVGD